MAAWKRIVFALVVLVAAAAAWVRFFPGAHEVLARWGIEWADAATPAVTTGAIDAAKQASGRGAAGRPAIVVALMFRIILAFKVFDEVFLLSSGGPGTSTEVVSLHLYKVFFQQNDLGYGALLSVVIILAIVTFLLTVRRFARTGG